MSSEQEFSRFGRKRKKVNYKVLSMSSAKDEEPLKEISDEEYQKESSSEESNDEGYKKKAPEELNPAPKRKNDFNKATNCNQKVEKRSEISERELIKCTEEKFSLKPKQTIKKPPRLSLQKALSNQQRNQMKQICSQIDVRKKITLQKKNLEVRIVNNIRKSKGIENLPTEFIQKCEIAEEKKELKDNENETIAIDPANFRPVAMNKKFILNFNGK